MAMRCCGNKLSPCITRSSLEQIEVLRLVNNIGKICGVSQTEIYLLRMSAWLRGIEFFLNYKNYQKEGLKTAEWYLSEIHFTTADILWITDLIKAPDNKEAPMGLVSQIICDAHNAYRLN